MTTLAVAYVFLCLGFCLGFVVTAFVRGASQLEHDADELTATPHRATTPRAHTGATQPALCACGYLRCVCPAGPPR